MRVVVVGCGRLGAELAGRLFQRGHEVSVVDADEGAFRKLPPDFEGRIGEGEAINRDVLHRAGIEKADAVAVVTDSDIMNAVVGHLAREYYHINNVVVRNHDARYRPILEAYNLQLISALSWGSQRIEEMIYHADVKAVFSAGNGEVEVYELAVPAAWSGRRMREILGENVALPVSITRAGRAMLPSLDMVIEEGDILHVSATLDGVEALRKRISFPAK